MSLLPSFLLINLHLSPPLSISFYILHCPKSPGSSKTAPGSLRREVAAVWDFQSQPLVVSQQSPEGLSTEASEQNEQHKALGLWVDTVLFLFSDWVTSLMHTSQCSILSFQLLLLFLRHERSFHWWCPEDNSEHVPRTRHIVLCSWP